MKIWPGQTEDFKPPLMSPKEKGNLWLGLSGLFLVLAATSYFSPSSAPATGRWAWLHNIFFNHWQIHNTRKLDGIRDEIDALCLPEIEKAVALTSLILAMDEVDSTLGHFTSYLKDWSSRSYKEMRLKVPKIFENTEENVVLKGDIFDSMKNIAVDFAYLDPPYGSNNEKMPPSRVRYASYYHVWATICKNDKPPVFGAALRREDTSDRVAATVFEEFRKDNDGHFIAVKAIEKLIQNVNAKYVALSYSSGGKATAEELNDILNRHGKLIKTIELDYKKNVMADMKWTNEWLRDAEEPNREFIFLIDKQA